MDFSRIVNFDHELIKVSQGVLLEDPLCIGHQKTVIHLTLFLPEVLQGGGANSSLLFYETPGGQI